MPLMFSLGVECLPVNGGIQSRDQGMLGSFYPESTSSRYFTNIPSVITYTANRGTFQIVFPGQIAFGSFSLNCNL